MKRPVRLTIADAKRKMLTARIPRQTPYVDTTMYVSANADVVSAISDAHAVFWMCSLWKQLPHVRLKTLDRMLREVWSDLRGFGTGSEVPRSKAHSTIRCSA